MGIMMSHRQDVEHGVSEPVEQTSIIGHVKKRLTAAGQWVRERLEGCVTGPERPTLSSEQLAFQRQASDWLRTQYDLDVCHAKLLPADAEAGVHTFGVYLNLPSESERVATLTFDGQEWDLDGDPVQIRSIHDAAFWVQFSQLLQAESSLM